MGGRAEDANDLIINNCSCVQINLLDLSILAPLASSRQNGLSNMRCLYRKIRSHYGEHLTLYSRLDWASSRSSSELIVACNWYYIERMGMTSSPASEVQIFSMIVKCATIWPLIAQTYIAMILDFYQCSHDRKN